MASHRTRRYTLVHLPPLIKQVDQALEGWPDTALTVLLVVLGTAVILLGLFGPRWLKPVIAAWVIAP